MKIYAFFMLLGCFTTLLIPETARVTLENLAGEREDTASGIGAVDHPESVENKTELPELENKSETPMAPI